MISPEHTLEESFELIEAMVKGVAWSIPMEFTLRYQGTVKHRSKTSSHEIRQIFDEQLSDYWSRDKRLSLCKQEDIRPAKKSTRFQFDVRQQEHGEIVRGKVADRYYYHEVSGVRFVPIVTKWRYLRCEVAIRIHRYEGDFHHGGIIDNNGDLDNKCKTIVDALRMPRESADCPKGVKHERPLFFCVLEDDRLIRKIVLETRNILGPRPEKGRENQINADIDIKIYPIYPLGTMNNEMLMP